MFGKLSDHIDLKHFYTEITDKKSINLLIHFGGVFKAIQLHVLISNKTF